MWVVLPDGPGPRVFGLPVRARNERVARRAGARVVSSTAQVAGSTDQVIVLTPTSLLTLRDGALATIDIASASTRRAVERDLLRQTVKPTDGWVSRRLNRPISRVVSYVLLKLRLSANTASVLTLLVGLWTALIFAQPGPLALLAGGILFHLASVLDGVDGEMARATLTESAFGSQLDAIVDQVTYVACFAGVAIGWSREGAGATALVWSGLVAAAFVATLVHITFFVRRYAPNASFLFVDACFRRAGRETGSRLLRASSGVYTMLRRDQLAVLFLVVSFSGSRGALMSLLTFGVVFANVMWIVYRPALVAAARRERGTDVGQALMV